ncbi:ArgS-related anticodon-binding protein NrtL [Streptomyces sp. NPDC018031]|uniref:ArgS-related anticodon-binding protein NrtL n=1 Tax=Streptomyces sp. NPDC018031 TaxID=3365033 RepID=UPI00378738F0
MTPDQLSRIVLHSVRRAVEADELRVAVPERVQVQNPPRPGCGDYATNVALRLAKSRPDGAGHGAREVAEVLRRRLVREPGIAGVEIAGPGFLNITLAAGSHAGLIRTVRARGTSYGRGAALAGVAATFAPAGEVRARVVTDAVVELLRSQGAAASVAAGGERVRAVPVPDGAGDVFARLGPDAARWALLRPAAHDAPVLDPARLLAQRETNPLFRVRYAHARCRALLRNARDLGFGPEEPAGSGRPPGAGEPAERAGGRLVTDSACRPEPDPYADPRAGALIAALADHPRVVTAAARHRAPDRLARHLETTADTFFRWLDGCPVLPCGERKPSAAHRARLALADATGTVLAGGLSLLGISAPDIL